MIDQIKLRHVDPDITELKAGHARLMQMQERAEETMARVAAIIARVNKAAAAARRAAVGGK